MDAIADIRKQHKTIEKIISLVIFIFSNIVPISDRKLTDIRMPSIPISVRKMTSIGMRGKIVNILEVKTWRKK